MIEANLYNRRTKQIEKEQVYEEGRTYFLYKTYFGRLLTELILKRRFFSRIYAVFQRNEGSKKKIDKFISDYNIDLSEVKMAKKEFKSFNDFIIRELKQGARPICKEQNALIAPADSMLLTHKIEKGTIVPVKGIRYTVEELVGDKEIAKRFLDGMCLVFRLGVYDYHRFCYIDDGAHGEVVSINGSLHSVGSISLGEKLKVYKGNYREYCVLDTKHFGEVIHIDVGALLVGKIKRKYPHGTAFAKGDEKGYFEFGGSTIILLLEPDVVMIDTDIIECSTKGIETIVKYGEKIGETIVKM